MTESQMTAAKAKALRAEFPKAAIGKLPKPYKADSQRGNCQECGGYHGLPAVHLDYVGHAAATDRLLTVDPEWTWRPFTGDEVMALPPKLRDAGLWIYLTVCGVTRPGVGDGKSAKECIGDAIRNAAMRFGVALDLWAKEDLHEIQTAIQQPAPEPPPSPSPPSGDYQYEVNESAGKAHGEFDTLSGQPIDTSGPMRANTRGRLFALFGEHNIPDTEQLDGIIAITGRQITSRSQLTEAEAKQVIKRLESRSKAGASS